MHADLVIWQITSTRVLKCLYQYSLYNQQEKNKRLFLTENANKISSLARENFLEIIK